MEAVLGGKSQVEVAETLGLHKQVVNRWMAQYREKGEALFEAGQKGRKKGSGSKLEPWQMAQVAQAVRNKDPDQLTLPFALWTREAVVELVRRRFGVEISRWTAGRYLKRWGFSPQKPARRAREQDPEEVQQWMEETYPSIEARAKKEKGLLLWGDEMGLRSDHAAGRSFSPKGETPTIERSGKRFGCNMISAIDNRGKLAFKVFEGRFTTDVSSTFFGGSCGRTPAARSS